jgi:magnesium transporter
MVSATFSSMILNKFEAYLAAVFVLFVPMLMDTGGNSGSQASVTLIRGLSLGEVRFKDMLRVIWKEVRVGSLCAAILGVVAFGKIMLVDNLIMNNSEVTLGVALVVSVTLAMTVIISKLIGATLPMLAASIKLDPAVMASPFITTIVDALALIIYFFMAQGFLPLIAR